MTQLVTASGATTPADTEAWLLRDDMQVTARVATVIGTAMSEDPASARRIRMLAKPARLSLAAEVVRRLREVLGDDLVDLLVLGLAEHAALRDAARTTLASPGSESIVTIGGQRVSVRQEPEVDLLVDGRRVLTLRFALDVTFTVSEVRATVRDGRLMSLAVPRPTVLGLLRVHGHEISRGQGELRLGAQIDLGDGVPVLALAEQLTQRADWIRHSGS